mgnify:CR=1 FL=1
MYRERVTALIRSLGDRTEMVESWESLRCLIEKLVLLPDARDGYAIDLSGDLAALLHLATVSTDRKAHASKELESQFFDNIEEVMLVAGVGFEPTTFRL